MSTKDTNHWMFSTLWCGIPRIPTPDLLEISLRPLVPPRIPIRPQAPMKHGVTFLAFHFEESLKRSAFHITH